MLENIDSTASRFKDLDLFIELTDEQQVAVSGGGYTDHHLHGTTNFGIYNTNSNSSNGGHTYTSGGHTYTSGGRTYITYISDNSNNNGHNGHTILP
jgi:hypothetical protein